VCFLPDSYCLVSVWVGQVIGLQVVRRMKKTPFAAMPNKKPQLYAPS
jgi:hypothetical protein